MSRRPVRGVRPARDARLRPLDLPKAVPVRCNARHEPLQLRLERTVLKVASVRERWRIDDEWWRAPIHRIYHQVVLEDGRALTLFRDMVDGRWYLQ